MVTAKSVEKSKTRKTSPAKAAKKPRTSKAKKTIDAQPAFTEPKLVPISPEFEEKLTKSYYSLEKYLRGFLFAGPLISLYLLYMVFKSNGELVIILNFLGAVVISFGLGYTSRLFTKQSKKSIATYGYTMIIVTLFSVFIVWADNSNRLLLGAIVVFFFTLFTFIEMLRLKKYNFLY
jgi:hypothetical protein